MKKLVYALVLPLVVVSGLVFANRERKNDASEKPKPLSAAETRSAREIWEASPAGIKYKKWEASPQGQKVLAGADKISGHISAFSNMEAIVTSLSLPPGSRLGFGVMVRIDGEDYILTFGAVEDFQGLRSLKVNDRIIIKSRGVSQAPKYAYPIVKGDYVERDRKFIYKRPPQKDGC